MLISTQYLIKLLFGQLSFFSNHHWSKFHCKYVLCIPSSDQWLTLEIIHSVTHKRANFRIDSLPFIKSCAKDNVNKVTLYPVVFHSMIYLFISSVLLVLVLMMTSSFKMFVCKGSVASVHGAPKLSVMTYCSWRNSPFKKGTITSTSEFGSEQCGFNFRIYCILIAMSCAMAVSICSNRSFGCWNRQHVHYILLLMSGDNHNWIASFNMNHHLFFSYVFAKFFGWPNYGCLCLQVVVEMKFVWLERMEFLNWMLQTWAKHTIFVIEVLI